MVRNLGRKIQGPLAKHYPEREDLFQQLVGALFRELVPQQTKVSTTRGPDGAIDIFIEAGEEVPKSDLGLRFPLIIECKDHDDSLSAVSNNIGTGWSRVQKKLIRQAESGWEGTFQPWKQAKSYLYCISACLPSYQARRDLTESIGDFFSSLPPAQKPGIEDIGVLGWSDLAPLFNSQTRLADAWLGTELSGIVGFETYETSLSGFRLYLKEDHLPLIPPAETDPVHPKNLLTSVQNRAGTGGLVIIGPGGVGKTRTCFEVARLAHQGGWRVLHILPGEPPVTVSDLQEVMLQGKTKTLLVIDYLDQMGNLDFGTIRHRLLPEATARGITLALLANARPGVLRRATSEFKDLFQSVEFDIRERRARIVAHVQEIIAPRASKILGPARVQEICGMRPIIGMFIARELERYAQENKLDEKIVSQLRQGDLQGWIRRRLEEDGLVPLETHRLLPAMPEPVMISTAAAFAAAPLSQTEMLQVIEATLATSGRADATSMASSLMYSLERSGWLEEAGYLLATPHDVIADELLEITLCDRELETIRPGIVEQVFTAARAIPRVLGRFSVSLDRVMGQRDFPEGLLKELKETVSTWLIGHAAEMGEAYTAAYPDEVSYALGAVMTGAPWSEAALKCWDDLISPWLALNRQRAEARHIFYRGFKELPKGTVGRLGEDALKWLEVHSLSLEASYVLGSLLAREDLGEEQAQEAVKFAMEWLSRYKDVLDAGYVLDPLLARLDLGEEQAQEAVKFAMEWLSRYKDVLDAGYVLDPLLARLDLGEEQAQETVKFALEWLARYKEAMEAEYVLDPLLARLDLGEEQAQEAVKFAMEWLSRYKEAMEAQFVFHSLLPRDDLGEEQAQETVKFALEWLARHKEALEAQFVFYSLLSREDMDKEQAQSAVKATLEWLARHKEVKEAQFVFNPLLARKDLGEETQSAVKAALEWLSLHKETLEAGFVLPPLLARKDLDKEEAQAAIRAVMDWLKDHFQTQDAEFIFKRLFGKGYLSNEERKYCHPLALKRLDMVIETTEASFLLRWVLSERTLSGQEWTQAVELALKYLRLNTGKPKIDFVFKRLLRNPNLDNNLWREAADQAFAWLQRTPLSPDRDHTLNSLCARPKCLTPNEKASLRRCIQEYLDVYPDCEGKERLIDSLNRISGTGSLSEFLREQVEKSEMPARDLLDQGLKKARQLIEKSIPASAAYYLSALLVLGIRSGDPQLEEQVAEVIHMVLGHPDLRPAERKGFATALYRSLDEGKWPNREEGERLLLSLGIHRPLNA